MTSLYGYHDIKKHKNSIKTIFPVANDTKV